MLNRQRERAPLWPTHMKRVVPRPATCRVVSATGIVCLLLLAGCAATPKAPRLTEQQRQLNVQSFDYVWTTIRDKHFDPELGGLDWEALRAELRPKVEQATTMPPARGAMTDMLDRLGQSHFAIIPAELYTDMEDPDATGPREAVTGIDVRVLEGHALVTSVDPGSGASEAGVKPGWEITRIGKKDTAPILARLDEEFEGKTFKDLVLARAVMGRMKGELGDTVSVGFVDGEKRAVDLELTLGEPKGRRVQFGNLPPLQVWIETTRIDDEIGYIAVGSFFDPAYVMAEFNQAMQSFMDAKGVIIDIRGNLGGIGGMAMGMAGWFVDRKGLHLGTTYLRNNELKFVVFPRPLTYSGPVALLVDGLSASTSEIFAGGLKDLGIARVFGARTAGAALPSQIEKLPNGDGFQYAIADYISQGGETLEGNGVTPDVEIAPTRETLLRGEDPVKQAAVAWIRGTK